MRVRKILDGARERLNLPRWKASGPNYLTLSRMVLGGPAVLTAAVLGRWDVGLWLYICFALTDAVDGNWARLSGQKTPWGAYGDPAADKLFVDPILLAGWMYLGFQQGHLIQVGIIIAYDIFVMLGRSFGGGMRTLAIAKVKQVGLFLGVGGLIAVEGGIVSRGYGNAVECSFALWGVTPQGLESVTNLLLSYGGEQYCSPQWWSEAALQVACVLTLISFVSYFRQKKRQRVSASCPRTT